jgi:signal transduction histidine kinase
VTQQLFRTAIGDSQQQYDVLVTHLSLIRDLVHLGHQASTFVDLCRETSRAVVTELGYERVAVIVANADDTLEVAGSYGQAERFGALAKPLPPVILTLARDVIQERSLLRWGGEGIGVRRPLPAQIEGSVVGFPLVVGGERVGAVMCVQVLTMTWDLVSQRALELVGEIVSQVLTLAQVRFSMSGVQRELESELGSSRSQLSRQEQTLRVQSERIAGMATSLIASNQAKKTFLALMSHELRTPLSVILGYGGLLREGVVGSLSAQQEEYLDRIQTNGRHLHQLVEDMLFFVDAETTRIAPAWSEIELGSLVAEIVSAMPKPAAGEGPTFVLAMAADAEAVRTDVTLLRRVLFHLLGNAFKFTEQGEVRLEANREADGALVVRIIDTGVGIAPEQSRRILELFRQGDDAHTRKHDGLGLGLNLVRACLGLLHGRCHIGPGASGGTCVELRLPRITEATVARQPAISLDADEATAAASGRAGSVHG